MKKAKWWEPLLLVWMASFAGLFFGSAVSVLTLPPVGEWFSYLIPLWAICWYVRSVEKRKFWSSVGVKRENFTAGVIWAFAVFFILLFVLAAYDQLVVRLVGEDPQEKVVQHFEQTRPDWYFAYFFFFSFVPAGFCEEMFFRGFVLDRLLVRGSLFAILVSSALHTSLHMWYAELLGVLSLPLYGSAFITFVFFGLVYVKSRNVLGLVLLHGLNNASLSVRHFFGTTAAGIFWSVISAFGALCLAYLAYRSSKNRTHESQSCYKEALYAPTEVPMLGIPRFSGRGVSR